ncbi:GNAT family N-acetyltransferase [Bacillus sp. ISL-40]|uniref:GNAT family N-acetyltransferase n=1 Tax=unclassified Bacillus (in: firmicutes) TaxID=185979 RepID=UPI001BEA5FC9|nr:MULTISPECIES: GNAT family N-acetyltransferase [unclassified Bacillus (in: firmicutes)]MBT2701073.1 GNAT family N-acetyltransferase [Bacillus sp. ISL-40]MBT2741020.1 GNAT family N-acetyltransferase [Bacillus sp. ISL-77]
MIHFKKCGLEDIETLKGISVKTFADTYGEDNTEKDISLYIRNSLSDEALTEQLTNSDSLFYLMFDDEKLVGYLKLNTEKAQSKIYDKDSVEIERIYVLDEFQQRGFGQQMLDKAIEIAKQLDKGSLWLAVWEKNNGAISFYRKNHFKQVETITFVLGETLFTGLVMKRFLISN